MQISVSCPEVWILAPIGQLTIGALWKTPVRKKKTKEFDESENEFTKWKQFQFYFFRERFELKLSDNWLKTKWLNSSYSKLIADQWLDTCFKGRIRENEGFIDCSVNRYY